MSFTNKVVIVTGSSSGIGAATAISYAKEGANIVIVGRNEEKLQNVAADISKYNQNYLVVKAELTNDQDVRSIVSKTVDKYGKIDILINNAGVAKLAAVLDDNILETFDSVVATNLRSVVLLTHLVAPYLIEAKGNIVNVSTVGGTYVPESPKYVTYAVSKAGLDHFTRCVALELAPKGVRVNGVKPGPVMTDIVTNSGFQGPYADALWQKFKEGTALDRISEPEEISEVILFLSSDKAKSITGSIYVVDNGYLLKH